MFYGLPVHGSCMRWGHLLITAVVLLCAAIPAAGAITVTINASPDQVHIGDQVTLNGTVSGIQTIAVYLFITGPDLDTRGVTLDNLNIPAGHGLFTTAPVQMSDGSWTYIWDTSIVIGGLKPGTYTVYAVSSPVDRLRFAQEGYATVDIEFLPSGKAEAEAPLSGAASVLALGIVAIVAGIAARVKTDR